jgi:hypothetical protein
MVSQGSIYTQQVDQTKTDKTDYETTQMMIYRAEMYLVLKYPYLIDLNKKNENFEIDDTNSQFFIIKSFSEEDLHKGIKYNIWASTKPGNLTLDNAYKRAQEKNSNVYLFFSSNGSGRFIGVARMKSPVDFNKIFPFWAQDSKWGGLFDIEWLFIKDVPFKLFKDITITLKDGNVKPVIFSRDTQEVPFNEGRKMFEIIKEYLNSHTILEHFEYYDIRQQNYEKNNPQLAQQVNYS